MAEHVFEEGDWVTTFPGRFVGTIEHLDGSLATIRLDDDIEHFSRTIYSSLSELLLHRDEEIEGARWAIDYEQRRIDDAQATIKAMREVITESRERMAEHRAELRAAKKIPVKNPNPGTREGYEHAR